MGAQPATEREAQVLALISDRMSNAQIAHSLRISVRTVEHHVSALLRKHGATDRRALAELADQSRARIARRLAGLPSPHTTFVGRIGERELVGAALETERIATLLGPGGVGKTRLATVVAEAVAPAFGNRGGFIDLVPVRDGFVGPSVAATLGVPQRPEQPLWGAIAAHLGDAPALLVLDSCEHLLDAVAELVARIVAASAIEGRLGGDWRGEFDGVVADLREALRDLPPGPDETARQLARILGHLCYARQLRQEAVDRYRQAAEHAPTPVDAAADLRSAADCAVTYRADLAFDLVLEAADKAHHSLPLGTPRFRRGRRVG